MKDTAAMPIGQEKPGEMLAAALDYAARGWQVFPCEPNGKSPIGRLVPSGYKDATGDEIQIRRWWRECPDANIGLALSKSGLVALDADTYKPNCKFADLIAENPLPETLIQKSARGGTHYVFHADAARTFPGTLADGVDIKHRGYILLEPSRFEGGVYRWSNAEKIATAPAWLDRRPRELSAAIIAPASENGRALAEVADALTWIDPDGGYDRWLTVLMALHSEFGSDALDIAEEWSASGKNPDYPADGEVADKFASFTPGGGVTIRTLFDMARKAGADLGDLRPKGYKPDPAKWFEVEEPFIFEGETQGAAKAPEFRASPFVWRDPARIPPREWLFGKHLIRGFASLTVAPGALGKSSLLTVEMLAMASGRPLLGEAPPFPLRVWAWNGEDPRDELDRRFHAAAMHYGLAPDDLGGRLMIDSGRDMPITLATSANGGISIARPVVDALVDALQSARVDVFVVDPFVTTHQITENDTTGMNAVAAQWRNVADRAGCAVELVHHVSKAAAMDMDGAGIYASRGSGSIIDAVRSARYLSRMTKDEAGRLGVDTPGQYFRVNAGKENMAPAGNATWRRMIGVPLQNGAGHWPGGDVIGVCTAWTAPEALEGLTDEDVTAVQRAIRKAEDRPRYSEKAEHWAGYVLADVMGVDIGRGTTAKERTPEQHGGRARVRKVLETWLAEGVLSVVRDRCPRKREHVDFVDVGNPPQADLGVFG